MSDDDFMQESDEEFDFEYEDEDADEDSGDVDIENKYYNAKQLKVTEPDEAINAFLEVPSLEALKGDWGFKGLKQAIKLEFKLQRYDAVSQTDMTTMPSPEQRADVPHRQLDTTRSS